MTQIPELFTSWTFWYIVGGAIVVVTAALLITILLVARSIASHAERVLEAAWRIERHTSPIPAVDGALETLIEIRRVAGGIAEKTEALAGLLHGEPGGARAER